LHFAVENIDHRGSGLIGPAWGETTTKIASPLFFDRGGKAKLGQGVGACDDQFFRPGFRVCRTRPASRPHPNRAGKLLNRLAPKGGLLFLHYLDVLWPDGSGWFTQSECPLGQLQIVCCKRHQTFGHARLSTLLGEPYAPFGQLPMVFGSQHSRTMTTATGSLNLNHGKRFKFD
jgi:hypothetical protein